MSMKQHKPIILILAVTLLISMTANSYVSAIAADKEGEKGNEFTEEYYGPHDGIEIEELRTETAKQFLLPDGTMQYIASPDRIHWKDETGSFIDIDNSIIDTTYYANDLLYTRMNKSSDIRMFFAENNVDNEYPLRIEYRGCGMSYGFEETQITYVPKDEASFPEILTENVNLENAVLYHTDIGYDFVYIPKNYGEKEYIIIHDPMETYSFVFQLRLEGLIPQQTERGVVLMNTEGDSIFDIGDLFAVDSNEVYCNDMQVELLSFDEEVATIRLSVNQEWMNNQERVYPVIIDPSVLISGEFNTYDTYVSDVDQYDHFYLSDYLRTGKDTDYGKRRIYIRFDLPSGVVSSTISKATIRLELYSSGSGSPTMKAKKVTSSWNSSDVTWVNQPSVYNQTVYGPAQASVDDWYTLEITNLAKQWIAGSVSNYGLMLYDTVENNTSYWWTYYSSDYGYPHRPEFVVNYKTNKPVLVLAVEAVDPNHYRETVGQGLASHVSPLGYTTVEAHHDSYTISQFDSYLTAGTREILITRSHGKKVYIYGTNTLSYTALNINEYSSGGGLWYNSYHLSQLSSGALDDYILIIFAGCETGFGGNGGENLPSKAVGRGAETAIGFYYSINPQETNAWVFAFFDLLQNGYDVSEACDELGQMSYYYNAGLDVVTIAGNRYLRLS